MPKLQSEWIRFFQQPQEKLISALAAMFDEQERVDGPFDFDRLMALGVRLAGVQIPPKTLSAAAISWANERRTERRLGIAAAFLNGLFKFSKDPTLISDRDYDLYREMAAAIPLADERENVELSLRLLTEKRR
jgi:hypothetical protein